MFPRPTGPYSVGSTELHLIDPHRDDPYVPGRPRELMISLWYPSIAGKTERAQYLPPLTARLYAEGSSRSLLDRCAGLGLELVEGHAVGELDQLAARPR